MQLIKVGNRLFNIANITHASYDVVPTEGGANEMGCVLSFGCDDTLIFYGAEALQVWELVTGRALSLATLHRARDAPIAQ